MTSPRIVVVGSANVDLVATTKRAPRAGETVAGRSFTTGPGGKGANQAIAAARAGGEVGFVGAVGDDVFAEQVRRALAGARVDISLLRTAPGPTGIAHIVVDGSGMNCIVVVAGANADLTEINPREAAAIAAADVVLLQLEIPLAGVIAAARAAQGRVILDPAPAQELPGELLEAIDLILPNEHEAATLTGIDDPHRALEALLADVPAAAITLGAGGVLFGARSGARVAIRAPSVAAVDTTAAGDALAGALAVGLVDGLPVPEALRRAVAAASLSVQRPGASASMPDRDEIDRAAKTLPGA